MSKLNNSCKYLFCKSSTYIRFVKKINKIKIIKQLSTYLRIITIAYIVFKTLARFLFRNILLLSLH